MTYGSSAALLMAALAGAWLYPARRWPWWSVVFLIWLACALSLGHVSWMGAAGLGLLAACGWAATVPHPRLGEPEKRYGFTLAALLVALFLAKHYWPGFDNPQLLSGAILTPDAAPFTFWLSFDKAAAGFLLLFFFCARPIGPGPQRAPLVQSLRLTLITAAVTIAVVLGLGAQFGVIRWEPKWLAITPVFFIVNLMFTCLVEEVFFRGILQARLQGWLEKANPARARWAPVWSVLIMAVVFAFAHLGAPPVMLLLVGLAGVGYGAAYALTQRLGAAVFVHVALNLTHFIFFTYPALAQPL